MAYLFFIFAIIFMAGMASAAYWLRLRRTRSDDISEILNDPSPLAFWTYTPQEWQQAVADEFSWGRVDGGECQIRICKSGFYVSHAHNVASLNSRRDPK